MLNQIRNATEMQRSSSSRMHVRPSMNVSALALACALSMSACEAQKPSASVSLPANNPATAAPSPKAPLFSEPAITGKIVDAQTKQPIEGAFVYGFYATHGGGTLAGGSKFGEHVKSFLAVTDANGVYKLDAWDTGTRQIGGTIGTKFPMLGIYKPGYDLWFDQMSGIKQYRPKSGVEGTEVTLQADGTRDWTKYPHRLVPLTKEIDRYNALDNSNQIMMMVGECGWEIYAPLLLAQHVEKKAMIKRLVPTDDLASDGYLKSGRPHPMQFVDFLSRTAVDQLTKKHEESPSTWKCSKPKTVFAGKHQ